MTREIELTQGQVALVDDEDYAELSKRKWCVSKSRNTMYAVTWLGSRNGYMHRLILDAQPGKEVDHINGNGLDNRRENIRICTRSENDFNSRHHADNTLGLRGIELMPRHVSRPWRARIRAHGKRIHLGCFSTKEEAHQAYLSAAMKYYGLLPYGEKT